jgi:hypothetical protein
MIRKLKFNPYLRVSFHLVFWGLLAAEVRKHFGGFCFQAIRLCLFARK